MTHCESAKRSAAICAARASGRTLRSIGEEYGITRQRVLQICLRGKDWTVREVIWPGCSTRLIRVLTGLGFTSLHDFSARHGFTKKSFLAVKGVREKSRADLVRQRIKFKRVPTDTIPIVPVVVPPPKPSLAELLTAPRGGGLTLAVRSSRTDAQN